MVKKVYSCGLEATLAVIGGKWKSLILWNLAHQSSRFGELRRLVVGVSEKMLIQSLKELEADELIIQEAKPVVPPHVEYSLSDAGEELRPVLLSMVQCALKHNV